MAFIYGSIHSILLGHTIFVFSLIFGAFWYRKLCLSVELDFFRVFLSQQNVHHQINPNTTILRASPIRHQKNITKISFRFDFGTFKNMSTHGHWFCVKSSTVEYNMREIVRFLFIFTFWTVFFLLFTFSHCQFFSLIVDTLVAANVKMVARVIIICWLLFQMISNFIVVLLLHFFLFLFWRYFEYFASTWCLSIFLFVCAGLRCYWYWCN